MLPSQHSEHLNCNSMAKDRINVCFTTTKEQYESLFLIQRCMSLVDKQKYTISDVLRTICIDGLKEANPRAWKLYNDINDGRYGSEARPDGNEISDAGTGAAGETL